ncbi:MAG: long-chain-fatty-acid--CoA ligase [Burkholderiales bacterium RIFCSPLOWO2_12_FULL_64_99]|uniref:long-chain-fatty-acid--CoA ligase n=1 Tax=Aquabacterium sp. TaxID=1872578 RepID=UPI0008B07986|nr:long-chain-fatty-acid--CoA ligase [Aquabacterium sp.]OGB03530.1 MAG: long-chain-fatty-acid--CoA ligase [Burkholderiales bacterium RIFCSPHIGHO2_12_FULL_63_20]OGB61272.1 MAG: long-chain-fatty-acid--CoA ligase [Burkholderiales bacterium RIFCSPLOWO2_12_FULL_64_99]
MEKIWLKNYPANMPQEIDASQYGSLVALLDEAMRKYKDRVAFRCMGASLSYGELDQLSAQVASWLQAKGLKKGSRVAVMMPNVLQYPVVVAGILRAGCVVVNVNPMYTPRELEHQLQDSGAEAIFILENFATTLQAIHARGHLKHVVVASMGDLMGLIKGALTNFVVRRVRKMVPAWSLPGHHGFGQVLAEGARQAYQPVSLTPDDVAFLQYTGGTTGVSKGATLLQRNLLSNVLQCEAWLMNGVDRQAFPQLNVVCALPLYHIFALTVCALMGIRNGACMLLIPNPRDIPGFIKELSQFRFHLFPAVNTLYSGLMNNPEFAKLDFSSLQVTIGGGMAVQRAVAERWKAITGKPIIEGYGLSETSPVATCNPNNIEVYTGTIGLPLPSTEVSIRDDDGQELALGQAGEICIRGPQVMAGYWHRAEETAQVMTPDGFFKTGDVGIVDEQGYVKIVDRKKDMVLVSGFNVYPNEVEDVAVLHPGVLEAAVIGVPDAHSGEAVKLFVVRRDPELTKEDLAEFCKEQLTGYKRPKYIEFRDDLPKSNVGKILRRELRDADLKKAA